ncbi:hypothetical protein A2755_02145 [Candidatus Wolfebacteria bacterium RIFCSPHIGHO2_01_FULL_48_22]|uniref:Antitoxin SocA-like Panacea domain-containing protein n=2 Tax=Candidatus Wolfeibacteriota TaxID=1752735 RepID=A0A1F8DTM7_9BACT|nr:MAG: hypothetical protein A2755_02145 [Candidatus Wolfebacteria bacterium RIFCSPHIGHO2_01_FULL_48_22]OGM92315.1 MAG: hypothetical protein A2935_00925 [Candidatus Wolfebacteria bacterium RIFCSPLOWO2_01_FULL_47_17b]
MQYQKDKFINAALYFAKHTNPRKLGITKLVKLLFYADFLHYEKYGRPIIGDVYFHLPEGPVPTISYDLFKKTFFQKDGKTGLEEFMKVSPEQIGGGKKFHKIEPLKEYNRDVFSESDLEIMTEVSAKFYESTGTGLAEKTHEIPFVKNTPKVFPIEYTDAIEDEADKKYLSELQEEDDEVEGTINH